MDLDANHKDICNFY